jgi:hypothetical protein
MTILVRPLGYTGRLQQLTWSGSPATVTVNAWGGGGGGGGGNDLGSGGDGSGGGFGQASFAVVDGDVIQVAVGGGGRAGAVRDINSVLQLDADGGYGGFSYLGSNDYYGGIGGSSGPAGRAGAGGGGGGATVVLLNGVPQVIAGGGGGGGGGGATGEAAGQSAPGDNGSSGSTTGQNGTVKTGNGGGGGAGGGGLAGGTRGGTRPGDQGGLSGFYGTSFGSSVQNSTDTSPATTNSYYIGNPGVGGSRNSSGTAGFASVEFDLGGIYVKESGTFQASKSVLIKQNNVWNAVQSAWIKQDGIWKAVAGYTTPTFENVDGNFGGPITTCISVCDESQNNNQPDWTTFKNRRPTTPFYLLAPGGSSRAGLSVPADFVSSNLGYGPITVARDNGDPAKRSNWFAIANLSSAPPGSIVEISVDRSGSMERGRAVAASYAFFIQQCNAAGLIVITRTMVPKEKWINPFL